MKKILFISLVLCSASIIFTACHTDKKQVKMVFNVPALIGKNIDEIRNTLGPPPKDTIESQSSIGTDLYYNEDQMLLVTFKKRSRKVVDFFCGTPNPTGLTDDYSDIMKICNVSKNNPNYIIIPVIASNDNTKYTGIRIMQLYNPNVSSH